MFVRFMFSAFGKFIVVFPIYLLPRQFPDMVLHAHTTYLGFQGVDTICVSNKTGMKTSQILNKMPVAIKI
jgi:hypothetical protein